MTYRLSMAVDENIRLEIEEHDFTDVLAVFEKMGGDRDWLVNTAKAAVARSLHGDAVGNLTRSMGEMRPLDEDAEPANPRESTGRNGAGTGRTAPRSDPWEGESKDGDWPGEASVERERRTTRSKPPADPWGGDDDGDDEQPSQSRSQGRSGGRRDTEVIRDKWGNEWTLGLSEAPDCDCGERSARVKAKSKAGKWYTVFRCAKGAGSDWRDKCDFSEFPG